MTTTINECLASGSAFSSHIRVDLSSGDVITKKANVVSRSSEGDFLTVCKNITVAKNALTGDITGIGFTDGVGGRTLIGGEAEITDGNGGELYVAITLTLSVPKPQGWLYSEKLFDVMTGTEPFAEKFTVTSEDGTIGNVTYSYATGVTVKTSFSKSVYNLTIYYDGEPALAYSKPNTVNGVTKISASDTGYLYFWEHNVVLNDGLPPNQAETRYPYLLGEEHEIPISFSGRMKSNGDLLAIADKDFIRVYGKGFSLVSERKVTGLKAFAISKNGYCAVLDDNGLLVFNSDNDCYRAEVDAVDVAITKQDELLVYYMDNENLTCIALSVYGDATLNFTQKISLKGLCACGAAVIGIAEIGAITYTKDGRVIRDLKYIGGGKSQQVVTCGEGTVIVKTDKGYNDVFEQCIHKPIGTPVAASGAAYLTEYNGKKSLVALMGHEGDDDIYICDLDADDIALTDDRLYYRRGDRLYYREQKKWYTVIIGADIVIGSVYSYNTSYSTGDADLRSLCIKIYDKG